MAQHVKKNDTGRHAYARRCCGSRSLHLGLSVARVADIWRMMAHLMHAVHVMMNLMRLSTVVQNSHKLRRKYWVTHSSFRSFARTAHSFACSALLAVLARPAAFRCTSFAHSPIPKLVGKRMIRCPSIKFIQTIVHYPNLF